MNKAEIEMKMQAIALLGTAKIGRCTVMRTAQSRYRIYGLGEPLDLRMALIALLGLNGNRLMTKTNHTPTFPNTLRAISIHAPWAWLICKGYKAEEYRSRPTNRRGLTLIHASASAESDYILEEFKIPRREICRSAIIGTTNIIDCEERDDGYAYILDDSYLFPEPVKSVSGQQSIFWGASTPERINAFNKAWTQITKR